MRPLFAISLALLVSPLCAAHAPVASFTENRGQWPDNVLYRALFPGGALFVERDALTYLLVEGGPLEHHAHVGSEPAEPLHGHAYRVSFEGANPAPGEGGLTQRHYENYFIGNDPAHFGTHCAVYGEVWLRDLWPGIDLHIDGREGLKYEFVVSPGADAGLVRAYYEGQDRLALKDGRLVVGTSAGTVTEQAPIVYQEEWSAGAERPGTRTPIASAYALHDGHLSFSLKAKADPSRRLVIDPTLTFGSFSGSAANNFGFTATYDNDGALYGGGIAFGFGYPVTLGVLQGGFASGDIDIGISKWTPDGTDLEWSTYIGGSESETPHSLVVNSANELYLLAVTGSSNFPTTPGCSDATFNSGTIIPLSGGWVNMLGGEGYGHPFGTDIAIAHFSADATSLLGSTYVGGSGNDGVNNSTQLVYNYGDHFRGEIALDAAENPVVATSTQSADAPTTAGAPQTTFGGGVQDAYLFRLNASLSSLMFATYLGGSQDDSGYGVQFASNGEVFMTGGTASADLPMAGSPFNPSYSGAIDGYIARFSANGSTLLSTTYLGTTAEDQSYFVQLNLNNEVFVVGQTHGAYPITPGKYNNPGSSQFLQKFSQDLSSSLWSTRIGNGSGVEDISPSAFLVSDCGQIYFSGWGGSVNWNVLATASTTTGLPVTDDAFQANTDGSDYYLMVLEPEAAALNYGTFIGGALSPEHVDGGTSRFDKNGNVYQAVCAGCWNNSDFPTTPGAWSNTNNAGGGACNLAVFKFNLTHPTALIDINGPNYICLPGSAQFNNLSEGGTDYSWDFGDNTNSDLFSPEHTWSDTGLYVITMVLSDSNDCVPNDTARITVAVVQPHDASIDPVDTLCPGAQVQLHAHGGHAFAWFPSAGLSDTTIASPIASPSQNTTYWVVVTDSCGTDTASIDLHIGVPFGHAGSDTTVCLGSSVPISAIGGGTYAWSPSTSLNDPSLQAPSASPSDTTVYAVTITTPDGCLLHDSLTVFVQFGLPDPGLSDTAVCEGSSIQLHAGDGDRYAWLAQSGITELSVQDPTVAPATSSWYVVMVSNTCGTIRDSAYVEVRSVHAEAWPDTTICPGESIVLFASGGTTFDWSPAASILSTQGAEATVSPAGNTEYRVVVGDDIGCTDTAFATVHLYPRPAVFAGYDRTIDLGDETQLHAVGAGELVWNPDITLTCDSCADPLATPEHSTTYVVQVTDEHGCKNTDDVTVFLNGTLYVPNTFTPDGDGVNDVFAASGVELKDLHLFVFDRWGENIFEGDRLSRSWDGTFHGTRSPIGTYVWRIDLTENSGRKRTLFGHVNLVR